MGEAAIKESGSSSMCNIFAPNLQSQHQQPKMSTPIRRNYLLHFYLVKYFLNFSYIF